MTDKPIRDLVDILCDELVFKHEEREPVITDWCCLRENSVREAIIALIASREQAARVDEAEWWNEGFGNGTSAAQDRLKTLNSEAKGDSKNG